MAKKTATEVYNEYVIGLFCGSKLLPKSFYQLSKDDQIAVATRIKNESRG